MKHKPLTLPGPKLSHGSGSPKDRLRHYVKLNRQGEPSDEAMCGYLWDRLHVQQNGEICQACVEAMRARSDDDKREREAWARGGQ